MLFRSGGNSVAELEQVAQSARDGAPLLAVVAADAADGADRNAVFGPGARGEGQAQHGPQYVGIARVTPDDAADLGIDIGGHECSDGSVVTSQAEGEVVLQLLRWGQVRLADVLPIGEDAQEAVGRVAHLDEAAGFGGTRFQEWGCGANLGDERLRSDPLGPGVARRFGEKGGQTTSMTRRQCTLCQPQRLPAL